MSPGDTGAYSPRVIEVVKDRLDPQGVLEITIVPRGNDRIEITMPLPMSEVKQLKGGAWTRRSASSRATLISPDRVPQMAAMKGAERDAARSRRSRRKQLSDWHVSRRRWRPDAWKANQAELDDSPGDAQSGWKR